MNNVKTVSKAAGKPRVAAQSWVKGAAILAIGGFLGKLIGAVYRIPLTNIIGAEGMGLYQMIFPMYSLLLTISSGGIPTALSRLVAEKIALGKQEEAGRMARNALYSLTVLGILCGGVVAAAAPWLARAQGNAEATLSYYMIAPAIACVAVISALRGYFQGKQNMMPSSLSQILEQVAKLGFGLGLAILFLPRGVAAAAAGAVLGVTLSELVAVIQLAIQLAFDRSKLPVAKARAFRRDTKELYKIAIPVTLGGIVMPLTQLIDSVLVINILKRTVDVSTATALYGLSGGPVGSLINMPVVLSLALGTAILPSIAASHAVKDTEGMRAKAGLSLRLTLLIALPCWAAFAIFSRPVIMLLYGSGLRVGAVDEPAVAGALLMISSVSVLLIALIQVSTSLLHAVGHNYTPVVNLAVGAGVKVALEIVLLPVIGIYAVAVSNIACYLAACVLDLVGLMRHIAPSFGFVRGVLKPTLATAVCAALGYGAYTLLGLYVSASWIVVPALAVAAVSYLLLCAVFGVLTPREMSHIPLLKKFGKR